MNLFIARVSLLFFVCFDMQHICTGTWTSLKIKHVIFKLNPPIFYTYICQFIVGIFHVKCWKVWIEVIRNFMGKLCQVPGNFPPSFSTFLLERDVTEGASSLQIFFLFHLIQLLQDLYMVTYCTFVSHARRINITKKPWQMREALSTEKRLRCGFEVGLKNCIL